MYINFEAAHVYNFKLTAIDVQVYTYRCNCSYTHTMDAVLSKLRPGQLDSLGPAPGYELALAKVYCWPRFHLRRCAVLMSMRLGSSTYSTVRAPPTLAAPFPQHSWRELIHVCIYTLYSVHMYMLSRSSRIWHPHLPLTIVFTQTPHLLPPLENTIAGLYMLVTAITPACIAQLHNACNVLSQAAHPCLSC